MSIGTIEERLKAKADVIGNERAAKLFIRPSDLRDAFKLCSNMYSVGSDKSVIVKMDGWEVAEVCRSAMAVLFRKQALDELREELINMQERLSEIID